MDVLADVLETFHLRAEQLATLRLPAPWRVRVREPSHLDVVIVHESSFVVATKGRPDEVLESGGLVVLTGQGPVDLVAGRSATAVTMEDLLRRGHSPREQAEGSKGVRFSVARFRRTPGEDHPVLSQLPAALCLPVAKVHGSTRMFGVLHLLTRELEQGEPGVELVAGRLCEVAVVQAIRLWLAESGEQAPGWLAALGDPALARALRQVHRAPGHPWTVAELARHAGLSRSSFCAQFRQRVGLTPMQYLLRWRMVRAQVLLREQKLSTKEVAEAMGYCSVSAFSRAFTRATGRPPGQVRRGPPGG